MAAKKRLAEAEWEVMDGVWHFDRQVTVRDIVDYLYPNGEKAYYDGADDYEYSV